MKTYIQVVVGLVGIHSFLKKENCAIWGVVFAGAKFMGFPTTLRTKHSIVQRRPPLFILTPNVDLFTSDQVLHYIPSAQKASLAKRRPPYLGRSVDIGSFFSEIFDDLHFSLGARPVKGCSLLDLQLFDVHFFLFD